jgi:hypothetical protein
MSHPSRPPPIATPARSHRCSVCAGENQLYTGDATQGTCIPIEVFHAHRGALAFCVCHECSARIVAAWATTRGAVIATSKAIREAISGIVSCPECGGPVEHGEDCEECEGGP